MATIKILQEILERLDKAVKNKNVIIIVKNRPTNDLINTLENSGHILVIKRDRDNIVIKPAPTTEAFKKIAPEQVKIKKMLTVATANLPSITGSLLVYTRRGVLDHNEAITHQQGGLVFGWCY